MAGISGKRATFPASVEGSSHEKTGDLGGAWPEPVRHRHANAQSMSLTSTDLKEGATIANEQVFKGFGCTGATFLRP